MAKVEPLKFHGMTLEEWDKWVKVPGGLTQRQKQLRPNVGLFRMLLNGQIVVVGSGTDKKHGIEKRLYDLSRPGNSSRDHHAGWLIHEHRAALVVEVLITGHGPLAQETAKQLKAAMIELHRPTWTAPARDSRTFIRPRKRRPRRADLKTKLTPYTGTIPKG